MVLVTIIVVFNPGDLYYLGYLKKTIIIRVRVRSKVHRPAREFVAS